VHLRLLSEPHRPGAHDDSPAFALTHGEQLVEPLQTALYAKPAFLEFLDRCGQAIRGNDMTAQGFQQWFVNPVKPAAWH